LIDSPLIRGQLVIDVFQGRIADDVDLVSNLT
jgi:hypothetical protein